jgi:long-chain fatty acid transport protein
MRLPSLALVALSLALAPPAAAAGLFLPDRGVRPLARGGAFVAGADDLGAVTYNIAGTYEAGPQLFADFGLVLVDTTYQRREILRQLDPSTGEEVGRSVLTHPEVEGSAPALPIPTLAASFQPRDAWVLSLAVWAPYAGLMTYPSEVRGEPAPQRYSLLTLDGSALVFVGAGAAYAPSAEWRVGIQLAALVGKFRTELDFSGCAPERFLCAPEDPDWDVRAEMVASPIVAPTGSVGAIWIPAPWVRAGLSFQAPVYVRTSATLRTRLPSTPMFERARQEGDEASISFDLPWSLRAGIEVRPWESLRVELAGGYEAWSKHDAIEVEPQGIAFKDMAAFPETYWVPPVSQPRGFQDSFRIGLGAEHTREIAGRDVTFRLGGGYESSAVPVEWVNVLAMDSAKLTGAVGVGVALGKARVDLTYGHVAMGSVDVDPEKGRVQQQSPVRARAAEHPVIVNGGHYESSADILGIGVAYSLGE